MIQKMLSEKVMQMPTDPKRIRADIPGDVENNLVFLYHDIFNDNKEEVAFKTKISPRNSW